MPLRLPLRLRACSPVPMVPVPMVPVPMVPVPMVPVPPTYATAMPMAMLVPWRMATTLETMVATATANEAVHVHVHVHRPLTCS